ncbi:MAG TPA: chalcone isomerase family protein [Limnobacter sp.]|nr:chalcone isomerase family protein [Limnobacter sp.]
MTFNLLKAFQALLLGLVLAGPPLHSFAKGDLNPPPKQVKQVLENGKLMGYGTLRWFGLRVYDGQLWSNAEPDSFNYKRDISWLELKYARDFKGADIAERSIEEIENIGAGTEAQRKQWLGKLQEIFPDVKKGHTLSALHIPGKHVQFFRNGLPLARVDDPELAEAFMGIWLDAKTSAPEMRRELIGLKR